jgi:ribosomal protein S18 acetylase RimI-like enzyme
MNELFRIRRARRTEALAIARVHVASWEEAYRGIIPADTLSRFDIASRSAMWQRVLQSSADVWVATEDDLVIGFVEARGDEISVLYLHPGWWRLGIGRMLLRRALRRIGAAGFPLAHLWVLVDNKDARSFYARLGGEPGESRPVVVGGHRLTEMRYTFKLPVPAR